MAWSLLFVAGLLEVVWAISLKAADGFTRLWPSVIAAGGIVLSMVFLTLALRDLPVGTAYAVWTGIGVVGTAILGIVFFGESMAWTRLLFIALIFAGILGLKVSS